MPPYRLIHPRPGINYVPSFGVEVSMPRDYSVLLWEGEDPPAPDEIAQLVGRYSTGWLNPRLVQIHGTETIIPTPNVLLQELLETERSYKIAKKLFGNTKKEWINVETIPLTGAPIPPLSLVK